MWRTDAEFHRVKQLVTHGLSDYKIAALTGIPRGTVLRWRQRDGAPHAGLPALAREEWQVNAAPAYCYLLGAYLGDGHVTHKPPNCWTLRIACDQLYPGIIDEVRRAMDRTFPGRHSTQFPASTGASDVVSICSPGDWARVPPARPRPQALTQDRTRRLAARADSRPCRRPDPGPDPLGRMPGHQPVQDEAPERTSRRVRLRPLFLHQPLRRHPADLHRALRATRYPRDAVQPPEPRRLASARRRDPGRAGGT